MSRNNVFQMNFGKIYEALLDKAARKGRTKAEVDEVIWWLTIQTESAITLTLPNMVIGPFAGVWIDLYNRSGLSI